MIHWLGERKESIAAFMAQNGQPPFRASQLWNWLHGKRAGSFADMKNLPLPLRALLAKSGTTRRLEESGCWATEDGLTSKWLFAAGSGGGQDAIESVLIVERRRARRTACVSCMAGCPLGCAFCASGRGGFSRNLDAGEIIEQAYRLDGFSRERRAGESVTHVVFMGMGEPLLNLDAVLDAADAIADPSGMGLSGRHITISTVGIPEGIRRLIDLGVKYRLALSLHAPNQALRERLVPAAKRWPLEELMPVAREFAAAAPRGVTFEYTLVDGVNASVREAKELAGLLRGIPGKVNLIPVNPVSGFMGTPPPSERVLVFRNILEQRGVRATIRVEKGRGIAAACGQLKGILKRKQRII